MDPSIYGLPKLLLHITSIAVLFNWRGLNWASLVFYMATQFPNYRVESIFLINSKAHKNFWTGSSDYFFILGLSADTFDTNYWYAWCRRSPHWKHASGANWDSLAGERFGAYLPITNSETFPSKKNVLPMWCKKLHPAGNSILRNLLRFSPNVNVQHSRIIFSFNCFISKVIWTYHPVFLHSTPDCYVFVVQSMFSGLSLGFSGIQLRLYWVYEKSWDENDAFTSKTMQRKKPELDKILSTQKWERKFFEHDLVVVTVVHLLWCKYHSNQLFQNILNVGEGSLLICDCFPQGPCWVPAEVEIDCSHHVLIAEPSRHVFCFRQFLSLLKLSTGQGTQAHARRVFTYQVWQFVQTVVMNSV